MSEDRKKAILERALKDKELLGHVPPIVAYSFGVLPIGKKGTVLTVACFARANQDALRLLRACLDLEIVATPFDERALQQALDKAFPDEESRRINFPTFAAADFLSQPGIARHLRESKVEPIGATGSRLDAGQVVLASLTYRGRLWNLEHGRRGSALPDPRRIKLDLEDEALAWTLAPDGPLVRASLLAKGPALLLDEFRFADEWSYSPGFLYARHRAAGIAVPAATLPHVIHPTEVQLIRIEADGSLVFHAYDHEEAFAPGASGTFRCRYHFLSLGQRQRREIDVTIHEVLAPCERARLATGEPRWGSRELARWFALERVP